MHLSFFWYDNDEGLYGPFTVTLPMSVLDVLAFPVTWLEMWVHMLQVQELPAGSLQEQKGGRLHKQKAPAQLSPLFPLEESGPNSFYNIITSHVKM